MDDLVFIVGLSEVQVIEPGLSHHLGFSSDSGYIESGLYLNPPGAVVSIVSHVNI